MTRTNARRWRPCYTLRRSTHFYKWFQYHLLLLLLHTDFLWHIILCISYLYRLFHLLGIVLSSFLYPSRWKGSLSSETCYRSLHEVSIPFGCPLFCLCSSANARVLSHSYTRYGGMCVIQTRCGHDVANGDDTELWCGQSSYSHHGDVFLSRVAVRFESLCCRIHWCVVK